MDDVFQAAYQATAKHEGGFVNNPRDPGGPTNMGVTRQTLREAIAFGIVPEGTEVEDLTPMQTRAIFRAIYWDGVRGSHLPARVAATVFDAAVHHGVRRASVWLQMIVGAKIDGNIGPKTIKATKQADPWEVVALYNATRLDFLAGLQIWPDFSRGFARRLAANLRSIPL